MILNLEGSVEFLNEDIKNRIETNECRDILEVQVS